MSPFVVSLCDCSKSFLTSRIPYLHFYFFLVNFDSFHFEINSLLEDFAQSIHLPIVVK